MINENYKRTKRLIRESEFSIQDTLIEVMLELKKNNPELGHTEIMDLFKSEIDKFLKFHSKNRVELPKKNINLTPDKFPVMNIPYGDKKRRG